MKQRNCSSAHWYVAMTTALGRGGRLRVALVLITPDDRRFVEFEQYCPCEARLELAIAEILRQLRDEHWTRFPTEIRTGSPELSRVLGAALRGEVAVRTDANSRKFVAAQRTFESRARSFRRDEAKNQAA